MTRYNAIAQPSVMFRRTTVQGAGGYTYERYSTCSDYDLWCRLLKSGTGFANLPEALLRYRVHGGQLKQDKLRDSLAATIDIKQRHFGHSLSLRGQARLAAEKVLLRVRPDWVMRLFSLLEYRRRAG